MNCILMILADAEASISESHRTDECAIVIGYCNECSIVEYELFRGVHAFLCTMP